MNKPLWDTGRKQQGKKKNFIVRLQVSQKQKGKEGGKSYESRESACSLMNGGGESRVPCQSLRRETREGGKLGATG